MKSIKATLCAALVLVMALSGSAMAGGFGGHHGDGFGFGKHHGDGFGFGKHHGGGFMGLFRGLDLSDEQKTDVGDVIQKYWDEKTTLKENVVSARENMVNVIHADQFEEAAVRTAFQQVAAAQEEMVVLRAKIFSEIRPILTPEQLEQLEARRAEKVEKMKARMAARESAVKERLGIE